MKRHIFVLGSLLVASAFLLSSCAKTPTTSPEANNTSAAAATTEVPQVPATPTPTEAPILPCNIAFESDRDGNLEIYTMSPDGSNQTNLSNDPAEDFDPVWSPDGTHIAFASNRENGAEGGQFIYVMLADGSDVVQVSQQTESKYPDWSPLGNQIVYSSRGDIYLVDIFTGTEVNLTNSPENDEQPKFSPDGQRIAYQMDEKVFVMDLDGGNVTLVTNGGRAIGADWSVDGRIFTHWEQPEGICFNCVVTADGSEVADAGGKGTIQEFLPFWTDDGQRVEMGAGDINGVGNEDIFLVGENFDGLFKFLTNSPGNDRNPDAPAQCGPTHGVYPQYGDTTGQSSSETASTEHDGPFVIGYTGSINPIMQADIDLACSEIDAECVKGDSISALADMGVDAIVNASNRWDVMGSAPIVQEVAGRGIPIFMLNAESDVEGVYNLSAEREIYYTTLSFMFKEMNDRGDFIYYNFGDSDYIQNLLEEFLKGYPEITAIKKPADYSGNSFTEEDITSLIAADPNLGAIWSTEFLDNIFWGIKDAPSTHRPVTECMARTDLLISWKNELDAGSNIKCIAQIRPGGTGYEGIYVAFFYLNGSQFKDDAFFEGSSNTLKYDIPVLTNESLPEWIGPKLEALRVGDGGMLQLPPMTPAEIKSTWFK